MTPKTFTLQDLELTVRARLVEAEQAAADCGAWWAIAQFDNEEWLEEDPYTLYGKESSFIRVEGEHRVQAAHHIKDNDPARVMRQCRGDLAIMEYARERLALLADMDRADAESMVLRKVCVSLAVVLRMIALNYYHKGEVLDLGMRGL